MRMKSTQLNILYTLRALGYMTTDQIYAFFDSSEDAENLDFYIERLTATGTGEMVDTCNEVLKYRHAVEVSDDEMYARIRAAWVLVNCKEKNIRDMYLCQYPTQLGFITEAEKLFDVAVINNLHMAQYAREQHLNSVPEGAEDMVTHIALVKDAELGNQLKTYGFDMYCILNEFSVPEFYSWDEDRE